MNKDVVLTELQIDEIKKAADKERRNFGIIEAPIAGDLFMLIENPRLSYSFTMTAVFCPPTSDSDGEC